MDPLLIAAAGLTAGFAIGFFIAQARASSARATVEQSAARLLILEPELQEARNEKTRLATSLGHNTQQLDECQEKLNRLQTEFASLQNEMTHLMATRNGDEKAYQEQIKTLTAFNEEIQNKLKVMADGIMKQTSSDLMKTMKELFDSERSLQKQTLETARNEIWKPLTEAVENFDKKASDLAKERAQETASLHQQLRYMGSTQSELQRETQKLVNSLRASPKTRGRWGEQTLKRLFEMAGLTEHVDIVYEESHDDAEGKRLRPDAIVRMPGGRQLVVDSKMPLSAYFDAMEVEDQAIREGFLVQSAKEMRSHVGQLGSKAYWDSLGEDTIDFVVLFVGLESLYASAMEHDPALFDDAYEKRVLIATPTNMLALLKSIQYGWRGERMTEKAEEIAAQAREIYNRLITMGNHVSVIGKSLRSATKSYNNFVGSLETSVLPAARRFKDPEYGIVEKEIDLIEPNDDDVREVRRDRDLLFGDDEVAKIEQKNSE